MHVVDAFDNLPLVLTGTQAVVGVNPFQDEHIPIQFNLAGDFRSEVQVTCIDLARFQRAPKGSGQSAARRGHNIVDGGRVGWKLVRGNFVVLGNGRMDAEGHGLPLGRQIRSADGPTSRSIRTFEV